MIIKSIDHRDSMLHQVIALGDKNKQTLGMLPEGAFLQHARNKTILAAVDDGNLAGYLLYRISQKKRLVSITHLCVSREYQGKGVSKSLLQELKAKYKDIFSGIMLTCRADYVNASQLWEKFGFKARAKKRSKAKRGEYYLVRWIYDFGNPNLFSDMPLEGQKIKAVLDSSVLIPLSESEIRVNPDVQTLNADWLEEEVEYVCTQEIFNELNRDPDLDRAQKTREFLRKFEMLNFKPDKRDHIVRELSSFLKGTTPNDESDRKQLAETIASDVIYFITLDQELLDLSDKLYEKYSLEVVRPAEFVLLVDEISNSFDYRSFRLAGANYDTAKLRGDDMELLVRSFCGTVVNETKQDLRRMISECTKDVSKGFVKVVKDKSTEPIAIYGLQFNTSEVSIELIRVKKSNICAVLFQQLIRDVVFLSVEKGWKILVVKEANLSDEEKLILKSMGFDVRGTRWEKICLSGIRQFNAVLSDSIVKERFNTTEIARGIEAASTTKTTLMVEMERKLWPLKIADIEIPVYIIPIRPLWAGQLFDFHLANVSLFGAAESLVWSRENIYYRRVNPVSEKAPARILWYISSDEKVLGRSKGIAATSYLDEVYVDRAKEIFRKYKRFGVYEWKDIYNLAGRAILSEIKALKFSDTEVFKNIIHLDRINDIMLKNNRLKNTFASPVEVSSAIFQEIYEIGKNE
jgi:predicted nucleic acid-binding protein/ribosomal protein S18 acetylase RimI-like enzyme